MKVIRRRILVMAASATVLACSTSELGGLSVAPSASERPSAARRADPGTAGPGSDYPSQASFIVNASWADVLSAHWR